ncbi:hypothetical protein MBANPS3_006276 [Mucor bainieri]
MDYLKKVSLYALEEDYLPMMQFFEETNYGRSVLNLSIQVATIRVEDFTRLPGIFPNITNLHWVGDIPFSNTQDYETFEMAVPEWRYIKTIGDGSTGHQIATALLTDTSTAIQLEDIKLVYPVIEEYEEDPDNGYIPPISAPLNLARNAQSLTAVNPCIVVNELKTAWDLLNQFTTLKLHNLNYSGADNDETLDDIHFGIEQDFRARRSEEEFQMWKTESQLQNVRHLEVTVDISKFRMHYLRKWTQYFSETFLNLQSFTFKCSDSALLPAIDSESYDDPDFMYNNQTLKKYCMEFSRFSEYLLEEMEENQFKFLKVSSQTKSLKKLTIKEREKYVINGAYGLDMLQLMESIPQLEAVEIDTFRGSLLQHNPAVIVSVLNSVPHIKELTAPALMSRSGSENTVVAHPCDLVRLEISYCQFKLNTLAAQNINQTFKNILDSCPQLETFSTQVNAYKDEESTDTNIALVFSFTEQPGMKSIQIKSLYETYFRFIINGKTTNYHQKHGEMRRPVPNVDETKVYIQIEAHNASVIDTSVMSAIP